MCTLRDAQKCLAVRPFEPRVKNENKKSNFSSKQQGRADLQVWWTQWTCMKMKSFMAAHSFWVVSPDILLKNPFMSSAKLENKHFNALKCILVVLKCNFHPFFLLSFANLIAFWPIFIPLQSIQLMFWMIQMHIWFAQTQVVSHKTTVLQHCGGR